MRQIPVLLPPPEEQAAIVRFLDHENRRIDRAIRAKKKLIALLNEQKQAIIHQAVTRGLDPSVPLKPSGIPWLGDIPQHWEVRRLKLVTSLQRGYDLPADQRTPGPYPVVSSGGIIGTHFELRAKAPGVVLGRYGSTSAIFYIESDYWPHNTSLFVTSFHGNLPKWCFYLLKSIPKDIYSGKSAVPGIDRKDLFDIAVPLPPVEEQRPIVQGLEDLIAGVNKTIERVFREIDLLREYRTRLTADVVTGKLDVRQSALHLPSEVVDPEPIPDSEDEPDLDPELEEQEA